ncbi:hypothetical protein [Nocardioides ferulae]|uniref:hypothetical protein n=1 Tax=Nocardioides ferulae TaxID=2340821 RepID=UPI0013DDF97E|nr:hypothetical protein [Nocardioides ferulae]
MEVQPSQLREAADQVDAAVTASGAAGWRLDLSGGDVGDDELAAAMVSFAESWTDGAAQLVEASEGIAGGLRVSATYYELVDTIVDTGFGWLSEHLGFGTGDGQ